MQRTWRDRKIRLGFFVLLVMSLFLMGCKSGGLMEMQEDANKPMEQATFWGTSGKMMIEAPFKMNTKAEKIPLEGEAVEAFNQAEKFTGTGNGMAVTIQHGVLKTEIAKNVEGQVDEFLDEAAGGDVEEVKETKKFRNIKIVSNKAKEIHQNSCRLVVVTYDDNKGRYQTKLVYGVKGQDVWRIGIDMLASDHLADEYSDKIVESFHMECKRLTTHRLPLSQCI